jgi:hypothetical protein
MERDYDKDVTIDRDQLEVEWEGHPAIYKYWSMRSVAANDERRKAVRRLSVIKATVEAEIRKNPAKFGLEKITENAVFAAVVLDKRMEEAEQNVINATTNSELLFGAVEAMGGQRKAALKELSSLWQAGYWSVGGVPKTMKEDIEKKNRVGANNELKEKLKQRRENNK